MHRHPQIAAPPPKKYGRYDFFNQFDLDPDVARNHHFDMEFDERMSELMHTVVEFHHGNVSIFFEDCVGHSYVLK